MAGVSLEEVSVRQTFLDREVSLTLSIGANRHKQWTADCSHHHYFLKQENDPSPSLKILAEGRDKKQYFRVLKSQINKIGGVFPISCLQYNTKILHDSAGVAQGDLPPTTRDSYRSHGHISMASRVERGSPPD